MKKMLVLLFSLAFLFAQTSKHPRLEGANVVAHTLLEVCPVTATDDFVFTGFSLTVPKLVDDSELSYACQITYQFTSPEPYGVHFQVRVRTADGISPSMTFAVSGCALSDRTARGER